LSFLVFSALEAAIEIFGGSNRTDVGKFVVLLTDGV
jgi:hypothetical protein